MPGADRRDPDEGWTEEVQWTVSYAARTFEQSDGSVGLQPIALHGIEAGAKICLAHAHGSFCYMTRDEA